MTVSEDFTNALGAAVTFDPQLLRPYDHDLGEMPGVLLALIRRTPEAVVAARDALDVAATLKLAKKHKMPVTPRGQASSGYGGAIPCRGGIVLDLCAMNRILSIDEQNATVDVEPGVIWEQLSRALNKKGLDNRICPTSSPSSTVGGWFAMGGVGIGSLEYGSIRDVVQEIDVAGLDGSITTYSGDAMEPFHQTCGILGVVTRLRLACRKAEAMRPYAVFLPGAADVPVFLDKAGERLSIHSASVLSSGYVRMSAQADGHTPEISSGFMVSLAVAESQADDAAIKEVAESLGGFLLDRGAAQTEWDKRFYPMRIKKLGPSVLVAEFFIPWQRFAACWESLQAKLPKDMLGLEAFAVKDGRLAVLVYILDDAGALLYPLRMGKAMIPLRIARRQGGTIYTPGMWFATCARSFFGNAKYEEVMRLKSQADPSGLLNPGKIKGPGLPFLPMVSLSALIFHGTALLDALAARLPYNRPKTHENERNAS